MFRYPVNSMHTSCGLLLSNSHVYKVFQKQSFLGKTEHTCREQFNRKCTLEENFGLSSQKTPTSKKKKRHRPRGLGRVPGRPLGSGLLNGSHSTTTAGGAFLDDQRPPAAGLFARLQTGIVSGRGPRGGLVLRPPADEPRQVVPPGPLRAREGTRRLRQCLARAGRLLRAPALNLALGPLWWALSAKTS